MDATNLPGWCRPCRVRAPSRIGVCGQTPPRKGCPVGDGLLCRMVRRQAGPVKERAYTLFGCGFHVWRETAPPLPATTVINGSVALGCASSSLGTERVPSGLESTVHSRLTKRKIPPPTLVGVISSLTSIRATLAWRRILRLIRPVAHPVLNPNPNHLLVLHTVVDSDLDLSFFRRIWIEKSHQKPRKDMIMIVFVTACIGRCRRNSVERRTWLGLGGVGTVVASGIAAYGVCAGFGKGRVAWFLPGGNRVSRQDVTTAPF